MNKKIYCLALGAVLGGMLVSCTNELNEPNNVPNQPGLLKVIKDPKVVAWSGDQVLQNTRTFGQGADFGTMMSTRSNTRAADTWTYEGCNDETWENALNLIPSESEIKEFGKDITDPSFRREGNDLVFYIPSTFKGKLYFDANVLKFTEGMKVYNYGTVEEININWDGPITVYNKGTWDWNVTSGGRHTVYNTAVLNVAKYANIGNLYNSGELNLEREHDSYWPNVGGKADVPDAMSIYSTTDVNMPDGGDFKAAAHIHGTLYSDKDLKIQNSRTQYICGLFVEGTLDMTQGKLQTAYIEAYEIKFDGAHIWLLPQAHIVTDKLVQQNDGCEIYGHSDSWGFVETKDIVFKNDNDFNRSYSDNVYLDVTGEIDFTGVTNSNKDTRVYDSLSDYLTRYPEDSSRFNSEMSGTPACGEPYGNPGTPIEPDVKDECPGRVDPDHKCEHEGSIHNPEDGTCPKCEEGEPCHKDDEPTTTPTEPTPGPTTPESPSLPQAGSEVEVNLALKNPEHEGTMNGVEGLVSKLSIHVRHAGDVEVFIPVNKKYYVPADDMAILMIHEENHSAYGGKTPELEQDTYVLTYDLKDSERVYGNPLTVTLTVKFENDGIRITTSGITEDVIAWCKENFQDGINFEVYNYFNEETSYGELNRWLNQSTIEFIDNNYPDYYINAFDGVDSAEDCTVSIIGGQDEKYNEGEEGAHLNNSNKNWIYQYKEREGYDDSTNQHGHGFLWGDETPAQGE